MTGSTTTGSPAKAPHAKKPVEPPPPTCVDVLHAALYDPILFANDSLAVRHRKYAVATSAVVGLMPLAYCVLLGVQLGANWAPGSTIAFCGVALLALTWLGIYVTARAMGDVPSSLFDCWVVCTCAAALLLTVSFPEYPSHILTAVAVLCAAFGASPCMPLHVFGGAGVYVISMVNAAALGSSNSRSLSGPSPALIGSPYLCGSWGERLAWEFHGFVFVGTLAFAIYLSTKTQDREEFLCHRETAIARIVTEELCRLNSGGAMIALRYMQYEHGVATTLRTLHKYRQLRDGGEVPATSTTEQATVDDDASLGELVPLDPRLLARLSLLVDRFDRFLPHLPSWLINSVSFQGTQLAETKDVEAVRDPQEGRSIISPPQQGGGALDDLDMESIEEFVQSDLGTPRDEDLTPRGRAAQSPLMKTSTPLGRGKMSHKTSSKLSTNSSDGLKVKPQKITVVWLDFSREANVTHFFGGGIQSSLPGAVGAVLSPTAGSAEGTPRRAPVSAFDRHMSVQADIITAFVDAVHDAADNTYGAVHGFIGDSVLVSWNTVRYTAQCESKAARFMCAMRQFAEHRLQHMTVTGCAITGDAVATMVGSQHKQTALTVSYPGWRRCLRQLAAFAASAGLLIMDEPTMSTAHYTVEARAVDVVRVSRAPDTTVRGEKAPRVSGRAPASNGENIGSVPDPLDISGLRRMSASDLMPVIPRENPSRVMLVFEALRDLTTKGKDAGDHPEEWMYTLANSERHTTVALRKAFDAIAEDKLQFALNFLQQCADGPGGGHPSARNAPATPASESSMADSHTGAGGGAQYVLRRLIDRLTKCIEAQQATEADFILDLTSTGY